MGIIKTAINLFSNRSIEFNSEIKFRIHAYIVSFTTVTGMNKRQKLPPYQRQKATKTVNYFTMSINATMLDLPHGMEPMEHQVAGRIKW